MKRLDESLKRRKNVEIDINKIKVNKDGILKETNELYYNCHTKKASYLWKANKEAEGFMNSKGFMIKVKGKGHKKLAKSICNFLNGKENYECAVDYFNIE